LGRGTVLDRGVGDPTVGAGLLPVATVYLTRPLVNGLMEAVGSGGEWEDVRPVLILVGFMAGIIVLAEILSSAARWVRTAQSELLQDHISSLIHQKSATVDMAFYESADYHGHLHRARAEANYRPQALLDGIGSLLQNSLTLAAMLVVLLPFGFWLPVALLVSTLPAFYVALRYAVRRHHWRIRTTEDERRSWYYDWLLTAGEAAAELRLFGLGERFQGAYRSLRRRLRQQQLQLAWHRAWRNWEPAPARLSSPARPWPGWFGGRFSAW
jgi:ATP-binding cassette subfamily B protein